MNDIRKLNESHTIKATDDTILDILKVETIKLGNDADLNHIDVSDVTIMTFIFKFFADFNGDISCWNVENVVSAGSMFYGTKFNGDISNWNFKNLKTMKCMFSDSQFNGDISLWNTENVIDMMGLFGSSKFNGDISNWNVEKVKKMDFMFQGSKFNGDLSKWKPLSLEFCFNIFDDSPLIGKEPMWHHCLQWGLFKSGEDFFDSLRYDWLRGDTIVIGRLKRAIKDFEGSIHQIKKIKGLRGYTFKD